MLTVSKKNEYFQALLNKSTAHEGIFYVGVKTTGVFCRPTCSARKPLFEHCEFFETAQQALLASFRPCKRCKPLLLPGQASKTVERLLKAIEDEPEKRWKQADFEKLSVHASTVRRQFKKRFGMTFIEYARARRMGLAMKQVRAGSKVIDVQLASGYGSGSGFRDAFSRILGAPPSLHGQCHVLKAAWLDTPLGPMIAIASEASLYLLEFVDRRGLEREVERLRKKTKSAIVPGHTPPIVSIEQELQLYFTGKLQIFKTPLFFMGSPFQKRVWQVLQAVPYSQTRSYLEIAKTIGRPTACRAVARANGSNQLAIVVPCHRVINTNGELGGYAGGVARKQWLIAHEKSHLKNR